MESDGCVFPLDRLRGRVAWGNLTMWEGVVCCCCLLCMRGKTSMGYAGAMRTGKRHIESFLKLNVFFFRSLSFFSLRPVQRYYSSIYLLSLANKCITAGQSVNCLRWAFKNCTDVEFHVSYSRRSASEGSWHETNTKSTSIPQPPNLRQPTLQDHRASPCPPRYLQMNTNETVLSHPTNLATAPHHCASSLACSLNLPANTMVYHPAE